MGKSGERRRKSRVTFLDALPLTRLLDIPVELSDRHLDFINGSGAQGRGQSCMYKFERHHQRDSIQSQEKRDHLALVGEAKMIQKQILGHSSIQWFEGRVEISRRSPWECDVTVPLRGEFSGKGVVNWVKCC